MIMNAIVTQVQRRSLIVTDLSNNQEVLVHYSRPNRFSVGDNVRITYDGKMTFSIPPQITASSISLNRPITPPRPPQQSVPSETMATVTQRGHGFLMVRDIQNNRQMRVNYEHAHHFCIGQRVIVKHDTIFMDNPPVINATDITPIC